MIIYRYINMYILYILNNIMKLLITNKLRVYRKKTKIILLFLCIIVINTFMVSGETLSANLSDKEGKIIQYDVGTYSVGKGWKKIEKQPKEWESFGGGGMRGGSWDKDFFYSGGQNSYIQILISTDPYSLTAGPKEIKEGGLSKRSFEQIFSDRKNNLNYSDSYIKSNKYQDIEALLVNLKVKGSYKDNVYDIDKNDKNNTVNYNLNQIVFLFNYNNKKNYDSGLKIVINYIGIPDGKNIINDIFNSITLNGDVSNVDINKLPKESQDQIAKLGYSGGGGGGGGGGGNKNEKKTDPCKGVGTWWLLGADALGCNVIYFLFGLVLEIFYFCADLMIKLFAKVVEDYILNIFEWFNPGDNIYTIWSSVRDITNILVLFSAIFIGLRRILGDDIDFTKNILKVFIFALLVNFSYPISRFFIDISNVIALFIYNSINGSESGIGTLAGNLSQTDKIAAAVAKGSNAAIDVWGATFMAILFMLAIFITFAVISIMILIRVFILILCVIFSPLMFAAGFLGVLDEWHNKWKDNYFGMLLYPPLLMLGLFLTFSILNSILKINPADINTSGDTASVTIKLVMSLAALLITTITANKFSGSLGKAISGKATGMAKTLALGGGALAVGLGLRSGLGAAAGKIKGSKWVQDKKENGGFVTRNVAGLLNSGANKVQNTRFKIGNYGVSDTYKDKLEEKKSVLDNKLAYLDRTDPEKALRAREALRTRGNTVGDIKNIGKIINDDPNYLAQVNNEKAALDTKAKNVSTNAPDKVVGDEDIKGQRDEAAARIRALRQKRSAAGYGIDTGYSPVNNSNRNSPKTSPERVFNDGEILEDNKREKTEQLKQAIRDRINNGDNTQTQGFKNLVTTENRIDQDRIEAEIDAKNKIENEKVENGEQESSSVVEQPTSYRKRKDEGGFSTEQQEEINELEKEITQKKTEYKSTGNKNQQEIEEGRERMKEIDKLEERLEKLKNQNS